MPLGRISAVLLAATLIGVPSDVGRELRAQSSASFDALVSLAEARMKDYGVPGVAIGVITEGNVMSRGLGVTNVEDRLPVTPHTVFPIASISKTFAATAIMRLVEQKKVDLKAPVRTYLPDFKVRDESASREATVWHLLTHLGGWEGQISATDRGTDTLKNFVASITDLMQVAPPGNAWSYNNAGFSIAGRVIEVVTGTPINRDRRSGISTARSRARRHDGWRVHRPALRRRTPRTRRQDHSAAAVLGLDHVIPRSMMRRPSSISSSGCASSRASPSASRWLWGQPPRS